MTAAGVTSYSCVLMAVCLLQSMPMFRGGSLSEKFHEWSHVTNNGYILDWIKRGVPLPFTTTPNTFEESNKKFSAVELAFLRQEIPKLLENSCIEVNNVKPTCVSPIQTAPKADGSFRLIADLRKINSCCVKKSFINENIEQVLEILNPNDKVVSVDIKNCFYHVLVAPEYRQFLGFKFENQYYVWRVLPFGHCQSPFYSSKILRPVIQYLREHNVKTVCYVDDFIIADNDANIHKSMNFVLQTLSRLGYFVNYKKSVLTPSHSIQYIGYIIDTSLTKGSITLSIPKHRINKVTKDIKRVISRGSATARALARITGQLISMSRVFLPTKLLLRNAYRLLSKRVSWQSNLILDNPTLGDLRWWLEALRGWNGRIFNNTAEPLLQITTDASGWAFGGTIVGTSHMVQGFWDKSSVHLTSNAKEMLAVLMTLRSLLTLVRNKSIQVLSDSVTTVAYINFQGGSNVILDTIAKNIWDLCIRNCIKIQAKHLAGSLNYLSDELSRLSPKYEWMLHPNLFSYIDRLYGPHTIDRFASILTHQLPRYNSRFWDPGTEGVDALHQDNWSLENNFINPPFRLLPRILQHLVKTQAEATIIAPFWPSKIWFNQLTKLAVRAPLKLPRSKIICYPVTNVTPEPLRNPKWRLYAWKLNGKLAYCD